MSNTVYRTTPYSLEQVDSSSREKDRVVTSMAPVSSVHPTTKPPSVSQDTVKPSSLPPPIPQDAIKSSPSPIPQDTVKPSSLPPPIPQDSQAIIATSSYSSGCNQIILTTRSNSS